MAQISRIIDVAVKRAKNAANAARGPIGTNSDRLYVINAVERAIARNGVGGRSIMGVSAPTLATGSVGVDYPLYSYQNTGQRAIWKRAWPGVQAALSAGDAFVMSVSYPRPAAMAEPLPPEAISALNQMFGYYKALALGITPPPVPSLKPPPQPMTRSRRSMGLRPSTKTPFSVSTSALTPPPELTAVLPGMDTTLFAPITPPPDAYASPFAMPVTPPLSYPTLPALLAPAQAPTAATGPSYTILPWMMQPTAFGAPTSVTPSALPPWMTP